MNIAVIGGGINGLCSAWALAQQGHRVTLFESETLMGKTSTASSKLLHGGLRYLEHFEFKLVKQSLAERQWWLNKVPGLTRRLPILYPIYASNRARLKIKLGLLLYDFLAGKKGIGRHRWLSPRQVRRCSPHLTQENLKGAYLFFDGQMDDRALGLWVAKQCQQLGVRLNEHTQVVKITEQGQLSTQNETLSFDRIINVAGPWSAALLEKSNIKSSQSLDLIRGSHLVLPHVSKYGHLLEVPDENRIVFVLPFKLQTLLGTTEVQQNIEQPIECSQEERDYLLKLYNHYFELTCKPGDILGEFSGLRPIISGSSDFSKASRDYLIEQQGKLLSVFGGKWTTSRALGELVAEKIKLSESADRQTN